MKKITSLILTVLCAIMCISCEKAKQEKRYSFTDGNEWYRIQMGDYYHGLQASLHYELKEFSELGLEVKSNRIVNPLIGEVHSFTANENTAFIMVRRSVYVFRDGYEELHGDSYVQSVYYLEEGNTDITITMGTFFDKKQPWSSGD